MDTTTQPTTDTWMVTAHRLPTGRVLTMVTFPGADGQTATGTAITDSTEPTDGEIQAAIAKARGDALRLLGVMAPTAGWRDVDHGPCDRRHTQLRADIQTLHDHLDAQADRHVRDMLRGVLTLDEQAWGGTPAIREPAANVTAVNLRGVLQDVARAAATLTCEGVTYAEAEAATGDLRRLLAPYGG